MAMISLNKEQRLANRILALRHRISITKQLPSLRADKLQAIREQKVLAKANRYAPELLQLERATVPATELFLLDKTKELAKLDRQEHLAFRAFRQSLYREEKLLDKDYNPTGDLSKEAQAKLAAFQTANASDYAKKRQTLQASFISSHPEMSKAQLATAKQAFEKRQAEIDALLAKDREAMEAEDAQKLADYQEGIDAKVAILQKKLDVLTTEMDGILKAKEISDSYTLPEDVVLRLENLSMHFGGLKAVDELTFDVKQGEIFGLIGPNGAGKTTVFNCITQFYKPTSGNIYYRTPVGRTVSLNDYVVHDVIKLGIVRTFQNVELIPELTVLENLLIAAHTQFKTTYFAHMVNANEAKREELILRKKAQQILEYLHLETIQDLPPVGLPYGILKRIELARTLMADAKLIILDEPAAGLNDKETEDLAEIIQTIRKEFNVTIFLVEHDMGLVMDICDHICAISFGRKLAYGTAAEIQSDSVVQEAYLGSEG
jgi:branched-chain amino acid transport system ATP-binding protein